VAHPAVGIVAQPQGLEPARLGLLVRRLRLHLRPPPPRPVLRCRCGGIRGEQRERRERGLGEPKAVGRRRNYLRLGYVPQCRRRHHDAVRTDKRGSSQIRSHELLMRNNQEYYL
jgi:hypothetical protein